MDGTVASFSMVNKHGDGTDEVKLIYRLISGLASHTLRKTVSYPMAQLMGALVYGLLPIAATCSGWMLASVHMCLVSLGCSIVPVKHVHLG